ncbi:hypothetical protein [Ralstonia syzygii]|uniref:hypothetical protein n=1 Tax=Ralstonia syzygii TaxID=28097 RepID=UPI0035145AF2
MREFIGEAFIFVGLLTIPAAIIGLISPQKLAKPGEPPLSRVRIALSMFVALLVLTATGAAILPAPPAQGNAPVASEAKQPSDAELLKDTRKQMAATEDLFIDQQNKFMAVMQKAMKKQKLSEAEMSKSVGDSFSEMLMTLDRAGDMQIPAIANTDAKRHITEAVDTHKKWALTQQAKIAAFMKVDLDSVKEMNAQADKLAMQEALALSLAYKAVGLPIE